MTSIAKIVAVLAAAACLDAAAGNITMKNMFPRESGNANRTAWFTSYKDGQIVHSGCVRNDTTPLTWNHPWYDRGFKMRVEIKDSNDCRGRTVCDTDMSVDNPGGGYMNKTIYAHAHAKIRDKCYLGFREQQDVHKAIVENNYSNWVWITFYDYLHQTVGRKIFQTGCVGPRQTATYYNDWFEGGRYVIRAEVKADANCGGRTVCNTDANPMQRVGWDTNRPNKIMPGNGNCYIDWPK